jgi:hypothetical protein
MSERLSSPISSPLMPGPCVGAITLASAETQHHNALSKLVHNVVHWFSTSAYTWDLEPEP